MDSLPFFFFLNTFSIVFFYTYLFDFLRVFYNQPHWHNTSTVGIREALGFFQTVGTETRWTSRSWSTLRVLVLLLANSSPASVVLSSSGRRPPSVSSVCHKVQMAEWCCNARLSGGLAGHHSASQPDWPAGSCSLLLRRWLSSTRWSAPQGSWCFQTSMTGGPTLLVFRKLSSGKLLKVYKRIPVQSVHMDLASSLLHFISCRT